MDAFISYRRKTGYALATFLYESLTKHKLDVFLDRENFQDYTGSFTTKIKESIEASDYFLLLLTDLDIGDYEKSVFIKEIETALKNEKKIIVIKQKELIFPNPLYKSIECLPELQAIEITSETKFDDALLISLLKKMQGSKKIKRVYNKLIACSKLESREIVESRSSLESRFNDDVISVDMCGIACMGLLSNARHHFIHILQRGGKVRIVINKEDSPAAIDAYEKKLASGSLAQRKRVISRANEELYDWIKDYPENFKGKLTEEFLPCAILIIRTKNEENSTIKVDYYGFNCEDKDRRCIMISCNDEENFNFYVNQFEWLWKCAKPLSPEEAYNV